MSKYDYEFNQKPVDNRFWNCRHEYCAGSHIDTPICCPECGCAERLGNGIFRADGTLRDGMCYTGSLLRDCQSEACHKTNACQGYEAFLRRDDERKAAEAISAKAKSDSDPINDPINRPSHYITPSGLESVDVVEAFNLNMHRGTVVTYILRAGKKGGPGEELKDLQKAYRWLGREINRLQGRREW